MLQIGVMPLPALMNSEPLGQRVGQPELALDLAEVDELAGLRPARVNHGDISPSSTYLTVIETKPSGWSGSEVSE